MNKTGAREREKGSGADALAALEEGLRGIADACETHPLPPEAYEEQLTLRLLSAVLEESIRVSIEAQLQTEEMERRRGLSLLGRVQAQQLAAAGAFLPAEASDAAECLFCAAVQLETASALAQGMADHPVRRALHFMLPEYLDMLYRLANLLRLRGEENAQTLLGHHLEIMPGRPLAACHRHPWDDLAPICREPREEMARITLLAAVSAMQRGCMRAAVRAEGVSRGVFLELSMISQQHQTLLISLTPAWPPLTRLNSLLAAACSLLSALADTEGHEDLRAFALAERVHVQRQWALIRKWILLSDAPDEAPPIQPFVWRPSKGYVRDTLQEIGQTLCRGQPIPSARLPRDADSVRYRRRACPDEETLPSHQAVQLGISRFGWDERFEIARHPIPSLRNRSRDATRIGNGGSPDPAE